MAFYSLIQYCPDFGRSESVNIGLLVYDQETCTTAVRVIKDADSIVGRFGTPVDLETLLEEAKSIENRLKRESFPEVKDLERFIKQRGNRVIMTPLRWYLCRNIADESFDMMFLALVTPQNKGERDGT